MYPLHTPAHRAGAGAGAGGGGTAGRGGVFVARLDDAPERPLSETAAVYWPAYFEDEQIKVDDPRVRVLAFYVAFFLGAGAPLVRDVQWAGEQRVVHFNFSDFVQRLNYEHFALKLRTKPVETLALVSLALAVLKERHAPRAEGLPPPSSRERPPIVARFLGVVPHNSLLDINASSKDRLLSLRGNVVRVSSIRPLIKHMVFQCARCGADAWSRFEYGKYDVPLKCEGACSRGSGGGGGGGGPGGDKFVPMYESAVAVDWQQVRLQELEGDLGEAGRIPRTLELELTDDLIDSCVPGDVVTVTGVMRALETDVAAGKGTARGKSVFTSFLDVHSIMTSKVEDRESVTYVAAAEQREAAGMQTPASTPGPAAAAAAASAGYSSSLKSAGGGAGGGMGMGGGGGGSGSLGGGGASSSVSKQFSDRDRALVAKISAWPDALSLVIASCVPSIVGNECVKLGLMLGLFGGLRKGGSVSSGRGGAGGGGGGGAGGGGDGGDEGDGCDGGISPATAQLQKHAALAPSQHQGGRGGKTSRLSSAASLAAPSSLLDLDEVLSGTAAGADGEARSGAHAGAGAAGNADEEALVAALRAAAAKPKKAALSVRSDPHVLVVGDPGMGKSQMLRAISALAPRGVYVSGQSASTAGLTATVVVEKGTGDSTLEAGALVLSDQGVCAIDEFDKLKSEHHALLEAMEQQRVSVAKAGIVSSLSARASVMAAANPQGGHYDRSKTISENLKMSAALLSRFDLVFILLDQSDSRRDAQLTDHVMASMRGGAGDSAGGGGGGGGGGGNSSSHTAGDSVRGSGRGKRAREGVSVSAMRRGAAEDGGDGPDEHEISQHHHRLASKFTLEESARRCGAGARAGMGFGMGLGLGMSMSGAGGMGGDAPDASESLETRLRNGVAKVPPEQLLPLPALRKYVAFARRHCSPQLLPEAGLVLKDFYRELRLKHGSDDGMPITTRQLESLLRLSEARAKIELADFVTREHALDVVELMRESLFAAALDDDGVLDFGRLTGGMSKSKAVSAFVTAIKRRAQGSSSRIFTREELAQVAVGAGIAQAASFSANDLIDLANQHGYLLRRAGGFMLSA